MENSSEKFFENSEIPEPEVELVKANALASRMKLGLKRNEMDDEDEPEGQLTIDVYQTPSEIVIESAVAGVQPEDLDVNVTTDSVSIKGRRRHEKQIKEEDYFYQECYWGRFSRSVILPQEIDPDNSTVIFKNGILTIRLPKLNRKKTKKLRVKME